MHQVEGRVDFIKRHGVGDQVIDIDLAIHVPVHDFGYVGTSLGATERGATPVATGHQLKRSRGDLGSSRRYTNDDAWCPNPYGSTLKA